MRDKDSQDVDAIREAVSTFTFLSYSITAVAALKLLRLRGQIGKV